MPNEALILTHSPIISTLHRIHYRSLTVVLTIFMGKVQTDNESLHDYADVMLTFALDVYLIFYYYSEHQELLRCIKCWGRWPF